LLNLEKDFLVAYWEQRGCGASPQQDALSASLRQQVDDLRAVLQWLHKETNERVIVLGISLGGTFTLQAVEHETNRVRAVIVVSPDTQTSSADAYTDAYLRDAVRRRRNRRLERKVLKLARPPYLDPAGFQKRAQLLGDVGAIESGKTFMALLRETLVDMLKTYGVRGTVKALRNLNLMQRKFLPEMVSLDLFAKPPRVAVPVHYVFGEQDALTPPSVATQLPAAIGAPSSTVVRVPNAGHHVHFDHPDIVRSIAASA
jgi:pimeloyl-ACP methyl ester carboxylesterase